MTAKSQPSTLEKQPRHENPFYDYVLFFFLCSFIGWIWEIILIVVQTGNLVNRGVLHGPWLPIYGCGGLIIVLLFNRFREHPLVVFLFSALSCALIEYGTGWYLETFKHHKWWDYSELPLDLNGRICAFSVTAFGIGGMAVIYLVYPILYKIAQKIPYTVKKLLCWTLMLIFLGDFIYSSDVPNTGEGITI